MWNDLLARASERQRRLGSPPPHLSPLRTLPLPLVMLAAALAEAVFALCCGRVPARRHPLWGLGVAALRLASTPISQCTRETRTILGFEPEFSTAEAFEHMLRGWRPP